MTTPSAAFHRESLHRSVRFAAGMVAMMGVLRVALAGWEGGRALAACGALALELLISSRMFLRARGEAGLARVVRFNAVATGVGLIVICAVCGGSRGLYFDFILTVPLIFGVLAPIEPNASLINAGALALGGCWLLWHDHRSLLQMITWLMLMGCIAVFAAYGVRMYQAFIATERRVERERRDALEQLAESERRRYQVERLALVGQLAAGVAHEINNPLAFIKSNVTWIEEELRQATLVATPPIATELPQVLGEALSGIERIQQIVTDLKSFSRDGAFELEELTLSTAVEEALRLARVRLHRGIDVQHQLPTHLPPVRGDLRRLVQVLLNLLVNAADALEGPQAEGQPKRWIRICASSTPDAVELSVADNGPAIPDEVRARLFEPFFTTKGPKKGTGLGLALSREFMQRMGGSLELAPGPETRFVLRVPLAELKQVA